MGSAVRARVPDGRRSEIVEEVTSWQRAGRVGPGRSPRIDRRRRSGSYPGKRQEIAEITCPRWRRAQHPGLYVHETTALSSRDTTIVDGIPITTVERTIFDLSRDVQRVSSSTWRSTMRSDDELTTVDDLCAVLRRVGKRGRKGTKLLRGLLGERDANYVPTESEREQMLLARASCAWAAGARRQFSIFDESGQFLARPDLVYRNLKIAMEYDSYAASRRQRRPCARQPSAERHRRDRMDHARRHRGRRPLWKRASVRRRRAEGARHPPTCVSKRYIGPAADAGSFLGLGGLDVLVVAEEVVGVPLGLERLETRVTSRRRTPTRRARCLRRR